LKLAAEEGGSPAFLFRPSQHRDESSPATLRLALAARDDGLDVEILKSRGGAPARIELLRIH
jgi:protein ImuA